MKFHDDFEFWSTTSQGHSIFCIRVISSLKVSTGSGNKPNSLSLWVKENSNINISQIILQPFHESYTTHLRSPLQAFFKPFILPGSHRTRHHQPQQLTQQSLPTQWLATGYASSRAISIVYWTAMATLESLFTKAMMDVSAETRSREGQRDVRAVGVS